MAAGKIVNRQTTRYILYHRVVAPPILYWLCLKPFYSANGIVFRSRTQVHSHAENSRLTELKVDTKVHYSKVLLWIRALQIKIVKELTVGEYFTLLFQKNRWAERLSLRLNYYLKEKKFYFYILKSLSWHSFSSERLSNKINCELTCFYLN